MAIAVTGIIVLIVIFILMIGAAALIVYSILYNKHIKKTLNQAALSEEEEIPAETEEEGHRKHKERKTRIWPSPWIIVLGIVCLLLLIYSIVVTVALVRSNTYTESNFEGWHYEGVDLVTSEQIADSPYAYYQSAFDSKTLEGYTLEESTDGKFTYYLFEQEDVDFSGLKPQFLLFVTCTDPDAYFVSNAMLMERYTSDTTEIFGSGQMGQYVLFAGNLGDYEECYLSLYLYGDEDTCNREFIHLTGGEQALCDYTDELLVEIR